MRRIRAINNITKIKYILVSDTKIYKVKNIDFGNLTIEATESDLTIADVPENELFPIEWFGEFRIRLCNGGGMGGVIDFGEWIRNRGRSSK